MAEASINVGDLRTHLVRSIRSHGGSEDNTPLNTLLYERPRRNTRSVETSVQIHTPQLVDLFRSKVQSGLVFRSASITYHTMKRSRALQYLVDGGLDRVFFRHICLESEKLVWVLLREGGEFFAGGTDVDGEDACGAVGEAAVCYAEADTCGLVGN
jgi:hypothetical protein